MKAKKGDLDGEEEFLLIFRQQGKGNLVDLAAVVAGNDPRELHVAISSVLQCVAVCCSVLQCVAVCCSVLQCIAVCCSVLQCVAVYCSVLQCVAVYCSVLQSIAVCCSDVFIALVLICE